MAESILLSHSYYKALLAAGKVMLGLYHVAFKIAKALKREFIVIALIFMHIAIKIFLPTLSQT